MSRNFGLLMFGIAAGSTLGLFLWQPWADTTAAEPPKFGESRGGSPEPDTEPAAPTQFAEGRGNAAGANVKAIPFDGDRAIKYLKELCDIGPRISGSDGMKKQQELLTKHFEKHGATVSQQKFQGKQPSQQQAVPMTNLIAKWHPDKSKRLILCAHYDTRPIADQEAERAKWNKPFLSANDGTSGVAFLMEMAHHIKDLPCAYGIDIVLFDGEEFVFNTTGGFGAFGTDDYFLGSEHFGRTYDTERRKHPWNYEGAVLFDLFAAKNARLAVEGHSAALAPNLVEEIWKTAAALKAKSFVYERGFRRGVDVMDDHIALNRYGIPAVDIIDFDYAHWHKLSDLPDQCSVAQMSEVANVITTWLQNKK